jgi:hypothetical protein
MIETVGGDALYDAESTLRFIIEHLRAQAVIPRNLRSNPDPSYTLKGNDVYCHADLPMYRKGKTTNPKFPLKNIF